MPPGHLALLPLQAAWRVDAQSPAGRRSFLEDWALCVSQSPQALLAAAERLAHPARAGRRALGVSDPLEDLALSGPGGILWQNPGLGGLTFEARLELRGRDATRRAVLAALPGASHVTFYCHGQWDPQDPAACGLCLAPEEAEGSGHDLLSFDDLRREGVDLGASRLWILAACETGPVGLDLPDEFLGLGPGLATEVPAVLATLYPVHAEANDLAIRAFLRLHLGEGLSPAQALRRTQLAALRDGGAGLRALAPPPRPQAVAKLGVRAALLQVALPPDGSSGGFEPDEPAADARPSDSPPPSREEIDALYRLPYFWAGFALAGR